MIVSGEKQKVLAVTHRSDVAVARRCAAHSAGQLGFDETALGRLAIVVTECATNILKHAGQGKLVLTPTRHGAAPAFEVLALDSGPGIASLAHCLRDGMSTAGTTGTGLGAMRRMSDYFDAYSIAGKGAVFLMRLWPHASAAEPAPAVEYGAVCAPIRGEEVSGDAWAIALDNSGATVLVADGLGHGAAAAMASQAAVNVFGSRPNLSPSEYMDAIHGALRTTRGAAVAVAQALVDAGELHFAGIGNISASIVTHLSSKNLISHSGIAGHNMRRIQQFTLPWPQDAVCVLHSDGLSTRWDLDAYPGLLMHHPALIAGVLFRDFSRDRDDATVVAFKQVRYS
ncbi:MAG TPA: ATP-binding protein [Paucimonas sp.]|nr:ATP-binding protein [Paucimonas sp.]HJW55937.1 ATP-binding protein [Burkholderiaceae bacterium]